VQGQKQVVVCQFKHFLKVNYLIITAIKRSKKNKLLGAWLLE
jgi:hypothetical protein